MSIVELHAVDAALHHVFGVFALRVAVAAQEFVGVFLIRFFDGNGINGFGFEQEILLVSQEFSRAFEGNEAATVAHPGLEVFEVAVGVNVVVAAVGQN